MSLPTHNIKKRLCRKKIKRKCPCNDEILGSTSKSILPDKSAATMNESIIEETYETLPKASTSKTNKDLKLTFSRHARKYVGSDQHQHKNQEDLIHRPVKQNLAQQSTERVGSEMQSSQGSTSKSISKSDKSAAKMNDSIKEETDETFPKASKKKTNKDLKLKCSSHARKHKHKHQEEFPIPGLSQHDDQDNLMSRRERKRLRRQTRWKQINEYRNDEDMQFFMSLLPTVKTLSLKKKSYFKEIIKDSLSKLHNFGPMEEQQHAQAQSVEDNPSTENIDAEDTELIITDFDEPEIIVLD